MPSFAHHQDSDLLLYSLLAPLLLILTLLEAAIAENQNESIEPSQISLSTQIPSPTSGRLERQMRPREPVETPPTEYLVSFSLLYL